MSYPTEILPQENYKTIDCNVSQRKLIRFFKNPGNEEIIDSSTGVIGLKFIADPKTNIADYSTNLLGTFTVNHIEIALTADGLNAYNEYCSPNEHVEIPTNNHFFLDNDRQFFVIDITDIENLKVDYKFNDENATAECRIEHTPMKWNFWHFSVRWKLANGEYLHENNLSKKWVKNLCSNARSAIVHFAHLETPEYNELNQDCYINFNINEAI